MSTLDLLPTFITSPLSVKLFHGGDGIFTITNKESKPISYKIKTTTPTRYVVRPRIGVIAANSSVSITITHRPSSTDTQAQTTSSSSSSSSIPTPGPILRDRFKVECVFLPNDQSASPPDDDAISKLWAAKPKPKESEIHCEVHPQVSSTTVGEAAAATLPVKITQPSTTGSLSSASSTISTTTTTFTAGRQNSIASPTMVNKSLPMMQQQDTPPAAAAAAAAQQVMMAAAASSLERIDLSSSSSRGKETTEMKLREQIAQLEKELKSERSKLETALIAGRAKEKELTLIRTQKKKKAIPITVAIPALIFVYLISWYFRD